MNNDIHPSAKIHPSVRELLNNRSYVYIGPDVIIEKGARIANGVQINRGCKIGENTNIQANALFSDNTIIGKDCFIGAFVCTADEKYPTTGKQVRKPIIIGNGAVVGVRSTVVASTIGKRAVLGAHSITYRDIPSEQVWVGTPAKYLSLRIQYDVKKEKWENEHAD